MSSSGPAVVRVDDVSKRFVIRKEKSLKERIVNAGRSRQHRDEFWALRNVDFEIYAGSTVGLVGANGSGKSTLLKLIGGIIQPTSGSVTRRGRLAALIELGAGFHPDLTGRENVYLNCAILGLSKAQTAKHFDSIVDFSGIEKFIDTQVKFYSSGMYIRLAFAVAVHVDPDVLLVDEVLAVGDEPFQRKCMDRIHSFQADGRTIVIVSHALDQVAEICDRVIVLEHGNLRRDGEPLDALRYLRADFEETRREERDRERQSQVTTTAPSTRVVSVELRDPVGNPLNTIKPGDPMDFHITVRADRPMENWILGIAIESSLGVNVFGTNSKLLGVQMPRLSGEQSITFRIPSLPLAEGSYTVVSAILESSLAEIDRLLDAAAFQVESDGSAVGYVFARTEITAG